MPKLFLLKKSRVTIWPIAGAVMKIHTFPENELCDWSLNPLITISQSSTFTTTSRKTFQTMSNIYIFSKPLRMMKTKWILSNPTIKKAKTLTEERLFRKILFYEIVSFICSIRFIWLYYIFIKKYCIYYLDIHTHTHTHTHTHNIIYIYIYIYIYKYKVKRKLLDQELSFYSPPILRAHWSINKIF